MKGDVSTYDRLCFFLAFRAVHAAPAAYDNPAKAGSTDRAGTVFMTINLQERGIAVVPAFGFQVFFWRDRVFFDEIGKAFRDYGGKVLPLHLLQAVCRTCRIDPCRK